MAKMLKKTEAEVDFSTGSAKNLPEVDLFPFPVFKFHLFWPIFQKNFQKKTNFLGISTGSSSISPKSADFSNFWRLHALCGKKLVEFDLFWHIFQKMTNFLGISTGSSSISTGSGPKSAYFSKNSRLHVLCGKKFWKFDLDLLKTPIFFIKFLKRFRYRSEKLAQKRSKSGELGSNQTKPNLT